MKRLRNVYKISKIGSFAFLIALLSSCVVAIIRMFFSLIIGLVSQISIDSINAGTFRADLFLKLGIFIVVLLPIYYLLEYINLVYGQKAGVRIKYKLMDSILKQSEKSRIFSTDSRVISSLTSDCVEIEDYFFQGINQVVIPVISGITATILLFKIDWLITLIILMIQIVSITFLNKYNKIIVKEHILSKKAIDSATKQLTEIVSNDKTIKLYNLQTEMSSNYSLKANKVRTHNLIGLVSTVKIETLGKLTLILTKSSVVFIFVIFQNNYANYFSSIFTIFSLCSMINILFFGVINMWNYLNKIEKTAHRILELIELDTEYDESILKESDIIKTTDPTIIMDNVSFTYPNGERGIKNISLRIKLNEIVVFLGTSGSGKSTLLKLLLRLYDLEDGRILINNKNIDEYPLKYLRKQIAYVEQEPKLLNMSIRDNIQIVNMNRDFKDIVEIMKLVNMHEYIESLPDSYDTIVLEGGSNLSGGQQQRIAIARALFYDAPILVLDEPISALDSENEKLIIELIRKLKGKKTILISTHRLEILQYADSIHTFKKGVLEPMIE